MKLTETLQKLQTPSNRTIAAIDKILSQSRRSFPQSGKGAKKKKNPFSRKVAKRQRKPKDYVGAVSFLTIYEYTLSAFLNLL